MPKTDEEKIQSRILSKRKYRMNNIEKVRASGREWYRNNREKALAWYKNNKELAASNNKKSKLMTRYGVDENFVRRILEEQDGRCKICDSNEKLFIDHDHQTGRIRGMLCSNCNSGIGMFNDDQQRMLKAIEYISRHSYHDTVKSYENLSDTSICN